MSARDPDQVFLQEFLQGNDAALEHLMRKYYKRIYNFLYRMFGSGDLAETLSRETFVHVYENAGAEEGETGTFVSRLYRQAQSLCFQQHQRGGLSHGADRGSLPAGDDRDGVRAAAVRKAVMNLPYHQRAAVVLFRYERKSYDEIAVILRTSVPAVKSLLSQARGGLRKALNDHLEYS
ncbi:MAG: RNA polymerase sigma factor [Candidatus Omnitrophota bacterium]